MSFPRRREMQFDEVNLFAIDRSFCKGIPACAWMTRSEFIHSPKIKIKTLIISDVCKCKNKKQTPQC